MLASTAGIKGATTQSRPYPLDLISGNAHADTGITYQDTLSKIASGYRQGYLPGNIRIVHRVGSVTAKVLDTMPGVTNQPDNKPLEV